MLSSRTIRDIRFEKGGEFTAKFIKDFDKDWKEVTRLLKNGRRKESAKR